MIFLMIFSLTSCKVSKDYIQYISKKENIETPNTKKVVVIASDDVKVNEFKKTFEKNFTDKKDFSVKYLKDFSKKLNLNNLYANVSVDENNTSYDSVDTSGADYVILFSSFEIANRVEWSHSGSMNGIGGMNTSTSVEYCIINVKVEVYDTKTNKQILDFIAIGEDAVFLFNFTKTFNETKLKSINHIINYLKSGKVTYQKY